MAKALIWTIAAGLVLIASPARAAVCTVGEGSIAFGSLLGFASTAAHNTSGAFSITCTTNAPFTLALDRGLGRSVGSRLMTLSGGNATIRYQIYQDAAHSTIFGDGTIGSARGGVGTGTAQLIDLFGQIPSQNISAVGTYSDSISVTTVF
jgi:spore coat protein U-like protein